MEGIREQRLQTQLAKQSQQRHGHPYNFLPDEDLSSARSSRRPSQRVEVSDDPRSLTYQPLSATPATIRVLKILPSSTDCQVQCQLVHRPLFSSRSVTRKSAVCRSYSCLSYTWGDQSNPREILVNDNVLLVRENLWQFLHQARLSAIMDWLWIDAICIDQECIEERNDQVKLMAEIYRRAENVYVWLGQGIREIEKALATDMSTIIQPGNALAGAANILQLCAVPYWHRLWIVQELLLSRRAVVMYGKSTRLWDDLRRTVKLLEDSLTSLPKAIQDSYVASPMRLLCSQAMETNLEKRSLADLLNDFWTSECKDKRDRVYGLLGLAVEGKSIQVDYNLSAVEVFFNTLDACTGRSPVYLEHLARRLQSALDISILELQRGLLKQTSYRRANRAALAQYRTKDDWICDLWILDDSKIPTDNVDKMWLEPNINGIRDLGRCPVYCQSCERAITNDSTWIRLIHFEQNLWLNQVSLGLAHDVWGLRGVLLSSSLPEIVQLLFENDHCPETQGSRIMLRKQLYPLREALQTIEFATLPQCSVRDCAASPKVIWTPVLVDGVAPLPPLPLAISQIHPQLVGQGSQFGLWPGTWIT